MPSESRVDPPLKVGRRCTTSIKLTRWEYTDVDEDQLEQEYMNGLLELSEKALFAPLFLSEANTAP